MSGPTRRTALKAFVGLGLAPALADCASAPGPGGAASPAGASAAGPDVADPTRPPEPGAPVGADATPEAPPEAHEHPAEGDRLVFAFGAREGAAVTPADVVLGAAPVLAYPADGAGGHVSDGRLDAVLLVRLDPETLSDETRPRSAEGIVAYSAVCTHNGCEVSDWDAATSQLLCPCHDSFFDPADNATVTDGPAPRRLAALPLSIAGGELRVAGAFVGRVGFQRR